MDIVFHALSAAVLARALGESRRGPLWAAAALGVLPDVAALGLGHWLPGRTGYSLAHSLALQGPVAALTAALNWRLAAGGLLHLAVDVLTHRSSTMHLLYPWSQTRLPIGVSWWQPGVGWLVWALFWALLLLSAHRLWRPPLAGPHRPQTPSTTP